LIPINIIISNTAFIKNASKYSTASSLSSNIDNLPVKRAGMMKVIFSVVQLCTAASNPKCFLILGFAGLDANRAAMNYW
jgi:hypothetical protein